MVYMISCLPAARAQVAGPSLAPRRKKAWTTGVLRQLMARSSGRIPCKSTCSKIAPFSKRICRIKKMVKRFQTIWSKVKKNSYLDNFRVRASSGKIQWRSSVFIDCIHAGSFIQQRYYGMTMTLNASPTQSSQSLFVCLLNIRSC